MVITHEQKLLKMYIEEAKQVNNSRELGKITNRARINGLKEDDIRKIVDAFVYSSVPKDTLIPVEW